MNFEMVRVEQSSHSHALHYICNDYDLLYFTDEFRELTETAINTNCSLKCACAQEDGQVQ